MIAFGGNNTAGPIDVATACNAHGGSGRMDFESETFIFEPRFARNGRGAPEPIAPLLKAQSGRTGKGDSAPVVAFAWQQGAQSENDRSYPVRAGDYAGSISGTRVDAIAFQSSQSGERMAETHATLDANNGSRRHNGIVSPVGVRRLTPLECERLQGFLDGWTDNGQSDSARYRQLGNAVAVPVIEWIGRRIVNAEEQP